MNNIDNNSASINNSEIGWNSDRKYDTPQNNIPNTQLNNEIGWGAEVPMQESGNFNNIDSNSNRNNNFSNYNRDRNFNSSNNRMKCHNCGEEGHFLKNCTNPRKIDNYRRENHRGNDNFRKPVRCYNCQEDGHFAKECTKPKNNRDFRSRNDTGNNCDFCSYFY